METPNRRPSFIPPERFREHMTRGKLGKLFSVGSRRPEYLIKQCAKEGRPIPSAGTLFRPVDVIVRAWAKGLEIHPPLEKRVREKARSVRELTWELNRLDDLRRSLKHTVDMSRLSVGLTDKYLLSEREIVESGGILPRLSGVYFLVHKERVVYVGQSVNVLSRIQEHKKTKRFDWFTYVPCPAGDLDVLESLYIHFLRPDLNGDLNGNNGPHAPLSLKALVGLKRQKEEGRHGAVAMDT